MAGTALRDVLIRSLIWLALVGLWISLNKPEGTDLLELRSGVPGILGAFLIGVGAAGYAWSIGWLAIGAPISQVSPVTLLRRGPYRYVRNPLYLSVAAILMGVSTLYRPWSLASLVGTAILALGLHWAVVRIEEPNTRRQFGTDYDEYCRVVPRWLPRRPRK